MQTALAWVVDDSPFCARLVARRLTAAGVEVVTFLDSPPALCRFRQVAREALPALIIVDGELPAGRGEGVSVKLRLRGYEGVIALVSGTRRGDALALRAAGIDVAVLKPLTQAQARGLVSAAARRTRRLALRVA